MTPRKQATFEFTAAGGRRVQADFSGGTLSTDGGVLWVRELDQRLNMSPRLSDCFIDHRDARFVEHRLPELVRQRLMALVLGYEDLNDHQTLRTDPLLAVAVGKTDPTGQDRYCPSDRGNPLAGASTLNRFELGLQHGPAKYRKIKANLEKMGGLLLALGVETLDPDTCEVVLDFDSTDFPIHGTQENRFFHGYYGNYCYLPLYCFMGSVPLWAQLRPSNIDASSGTLEALAQIVPAIRKRCPHARIIVRGDSGFCRDAIMTYCEAQSEVFFCLGLARNARLQARLEQPFFSARITACLTGGQAREFIEFDYQTLDSWSRSRRVIGKAEVLLKGDNPRFIVTSLPHDGFSAQEIHRFAPHSCYENFYCARGDMENRIKEQQLDLGADRTSTHYMQANQLRLYFATFAYVLLECFRSRLLHGTALAHATVGTLRLKLLKIAAQVHVSCRRILVRFASAFPLQDIAAIVQSRIQAWTPAIE
jgi:hypothetical protein